MMTVERIEILLGLKSKTLAEIFDDKYIPEPNSGCWLWTAQLETGFGYGLISGRPRPCLAHRASWALHRGGIPDGMVVCHRCDNPQCVNPDHLFLGTQTDNMADMDSKGRRVNPPRRTGVNNPLAKLSPTRISEIIARKSRGERIRDLAPEYGVSESAVRQALRGDTWR